VKILHIISGDLWAGAEVQAYTLMKALHELPDVQVAAAVMNAGELVTRLETLRIPVTLLPETELGSWGILRGLRSIMKSWQPDIVHTHRVKENILGSIANAMYLRVPSVRTVHGAGEHATHSFRTRLLQRMDTWCGNHLQQRIVAVSNELAERLTTQFAPDSLVVIENGVDAEDIRSRVHPAGFRTQFPQGTHVGLIGRLVPVKRVDLFVATAALLARRYPERDWHFHVFGDGPLLPKLESQVRTLDLESIMAFHGHCPDIAANLASLDVLVMCSDHEGLPMTILEAMATGTPIVAHAVGGLPQTLGGIQRSSLVKEHSPEGYANAIVDIIKNPAAAATDRELPVHLSASGNAGRMFRLYTSLLKH
jgi:glycosyltransferase involved in cell wall biosynthesis